MYFFSSQAKPLALSIAALYLAAAMLSVRVKNASALNAPHITLFIAVLGHIALLISTLYITTSQAALNLGFAQALSLTACIGVCLYLIESMWLPMNGLLPAVISLPFIAVPLAVWVTPTPVYLNGWAAVHVLFAIAGHGLALLACGHALLLLALNRALKNTASGGWVQSLASHSPPLVVLERLLIRLSVWVAALLLLSIGFAWFVGHMRWDHKTVLTLASLLAWLTIAYGYHRRAWRGGRLFGMVCFATALLLMSYIGSRFVLQAVLHR